VAAPGDHRPNDGVPLPYLGGAAQGVDDPSHWFGVTGGGCRSSPL
jgi:hypothetical protein